MSNKTQSSKQKTKKQSGSQTTIGSIVVTLLLAAALWYFQGGTTTQPEPDNQSADQIAQATDDGTAGALLTAEADEPTATEPPVEPTPEPTVAATSTTDAEPTVASTEPPAVAAAVATATPEPPPTDTPTVVPTATSTTPPTATAVPTKAPRAGPYGMRTIRMDQLPPEAIDTINLIWDNGPFPFDQDDTTFGNREGRLPKEGYDYYREFTVITPGLSHRGAKRIIEGEEGELYYTEDHYDSFYWVITE